MTPTILFVLRATAAILAIGAAVALMLAVVLSA